MDLDFWIFDLESSNWIFLIFDLEFWISILEFWILNLEFELADTEPGVLLRFVSEHPIILFDGVCNYCNTMVNFAIRRDPQKIFRFAPLQSPEGAAVLTKWGLPPDKLDSFVLIDNGGVYTKSTAALQVAKKLTPPWNWLSVFMVVPLFIRDGVYHIIARNRYRWFGKLDQCMVPTQEVRSRFL